MGVITTGVIPAGKVFGPIPPNLTLTDPALLIGHMTCDNRPDVHTVKLDLNDYSDERRAGEWVPYVQAARDEREQNLEAYLQDGRLRYRAVRTIGAGEGVLVWYSKELAVVLGVPELQSFHIREGGVFQCPYCMSNFRFPNSLRAHMRFKCEHRRNIHPMDPIQASVAMATKEMKEKLLSSGFVDYRAHMYASFNPHRLSFAGQVSPEVLPPSGTIPSPASSSGSTTLPSPGKLSPAPEHQRMQHSPHTNRSPVNGSPVGSQGRGSPVGDQPSRKRSIDEREAEYSLSAKRLATEESRKPEALSPREGSSSPESSSHRYSPPSSINSEKISVDVNQNVHNTSDDEENISAFRKVEKHCPSLRESTRQHSPEQKPFNLASLNAGAVPYSPAVHGSVKVSMLSKNFSHPAAAMMSRYPLLPPSALPFIPPSRFNENVPINLADMYRDPMKLAQMAAAEAGGKLAEIHNTENNNVPAYFRGQQSSLVASMPFGYYKAVNPMVDKLLTTSVRPQAVTSSNFAALSQNWCAKCNATFRMTSDLVYHMRSHHSTKFDPIKKKREDKLKCNICGETFRERHHLTRHMTSHA